MQGWRSTYEDAHASWCAGSSGTFWVAGGHGGDGTANFCAAQLAQEFRDTLEAEGQLPASDRIEQGFLAVDARLREHVGDGPEKKSGAAAAGVLVARQGDGTYSLKLAHCGDARCIIVRAPEEEEASAVALAVARPQGSEQLGHADCQWPVVLENAAHRPNHAAERARIEAAGGHVSQEEPPRLEDSLAVSRAFGDFEFKADGDRPPTEQRLTCVPDIYEVSGLQPGSLCLLGTGGLWGAVPGATAAGLARDLLVAEHSADLGDLAAKLLRAGLRLKSQSNMTLMIVSLSSRQEHVSSQVEMQNFSKLGEEELAALPEDSRRQHLAFLRKAGFPATPCPCAVCGRWVLGMSQCTCQAAFYCDKRCQKAGWKEHKLQCTKAKAKKG